jgi:hypothetical protein
MKKRRPGTVAIQIKRKTNTIVVMGNRKIGETFEGIGRVLKDGCLVGKSFVLTDFRPVSSSKKE